jgi:ectoine hydroxylase-related dioxygenase (phytanoyl-CoA dioxygenase family)
MFTDFVRLCEQATASTDYPLAAEIQQRIPIYDGPKILAGSPDDVRAEWCRVIGEGPGALVIRDAVDPEAVAGMTALFYELIADERRHGHVEADHYAKHGANSRLWNAIQKTAPAAPELWVRYHASPLLALACEAWLGPWYQITTQVNVVHPGGEAQFPHRDYHLGFQTEADCDRFPRHAHRLSQALTLQGAVAHTAMSVESGPTMLLPYSQTYEDGYRHWRHAEFADYFRAHAVQLPMEVGDAAFFNPGLHHAAGTNHTDRDRVANLFQISSCMGIPMEAVDRYAITRAVYPALLAADLDERSLAAAIAATADGYSFPSNVDTDPPLNGLAPPTAQMLLADARRERWTPERFGEALEAHCRRRQP